MTIMIQMDQKLEKMILTSTNQIELEIFYSILKLTNKFLHTRDFSYFVFYSTVRKFFTNEKSATHHATHCICSILPFIDLLFISRLSQGMKNKTVAFEE